MLIKAQKSHRNGIYIIECIALCKFIIEFQGRGNDLTESIPSEFLLLNIRRAVLSTAGHDPASTIWLAGLATPLHKFGVILLRPLELHWR